MPPPSKVSETAKTQRQNITQISSSFYVRQLIKSKSTSPMSEPSQDVPLKVHYFYIRGQCQPIRNLLYYLQVDFQDIMHEKTVQKSIDASFNQGYPMIEDGQVVVHDAIAIMNYLCRKYNRVDLLGLTPQTFAKTQEILVRHSLQKKRIITSIYDMINYLSIMEEADRERVIRERLRRMLSQCKFVEFCLKSSFNTKDFVSERLSLVDFLFYEICFYLHGFFYQELKKHKYFKHFFEFKKNFEKQPFFKKNLSKFDEKFIFFEFDNLDMNKKIEKFWKGSSKCLKEVPKSN